MNTPYHVQVYCVEGTICRGLFYKDGPKFTVRLEDGSGNVHDGGQWPSISNADTAARKLAKELATKKDPLTEHVNRGARLVVTFDSSDKKYAIVAGYPRGAWEDTGTRFDTQKEARERIDAVR